MPKFKQYKIARRLGVRVFPKTENPKFVVSARSNRSKKHQRPMSEFGLQLLEKQKVRYCYGLRERQFANYINKAVEKKDANSVEYLYRMLESRLDNVVFRLGFAKTRAQARQMVTHGHIVVNGKKNSMPSFEVKPGDVISARTGSKGKPLFLEAPERLKEYVPPTWLSLEAKAVEGKVLSAPAADAYSDALFNLTSVLEFYSR